MGSEDIERQSLNVFRMKTLGATVVPVNSGSKTLKDAINEAMRDWVTSKKEEKQQRKEEEKQKRRKKRRGEEKLDEEREEMKDVFC